jgi:TonB-linked SusC/RagA family outer membrane protein
MLAVGLSIAQTTRVTGLVVSADDGEPIIGATVLAKGTTVGTVTDIDGKFALDVPHAVKTLQVSYVGMKSVDVAVKPTLRITLSSESKDLDEVVVVAYGTTSREAKTGAVNTVKSDQIIDIPASSVDKMLSGKMAGVMITSSSGQPGASTDIRIRGTSSITAGNSPLYVIDGVAVMTGDQSVTVNTSNAIAMINPNDIESITVLKDAAAASVYGSRAANGVILITTKAGKEGRAKFTARAKYGVSTIANDNNFRMMTPSELLEYQRVAIVNAGKNPDDPTGTYYRPYELLTRTQTNWMDQMTRTGSMQEYEITASGGSAKNSYYSSLSYHDNEGIFYGIDFKKMQARVNADQELTKTLKTGVRVNVGYMYTEDIAMQGLYYTNPIFAGMLILPWTPAYNEDGSHNTAITENSNVNPRANAEYNDQWEKQYRFNGNMYLQWTPVKNLVLKTTNAAEMAFTEGRNYTSYKVYPYDGYPYLYTTQAQFRLLTTSNTINYNNVINDHAFRVLAGQEAVHKHTWYFTESSQEVSEDIPYHVSGNSTNDIYQWIQSEALLSFFGIVDYNYASRYFLQASVRGDGSSKFGKNSKWGCFYSFGGSWNAHNETFMKDIPWLNQAKLRVSYGINGNNNIEPYQSYGVYSQSVYNGVTGLVPSSPANDDLSWEKNAAWNFGLDFGFLKRFTGSIDYYTRKTSDMLLSKALSSTSGFTYSYQNVGSIRNKGIEFQIDANIISTRDWQWNAGFNIAHNQSKVLELAGDEMMNYSTDSRLKHIVGEKLFTFYLKDYYGVNPVNGEALWRTADGSLTNDYNQAAYVKSGSPEPTYTGGFNTDVSWKGLQLSVQLEFKGGNKIYIAENRYFHSDGNYMSYNQAASALNYWKQPGDTGVNPKPIAGNTSNSYSYDSNRFIENGDYLRIKDVTLSYTLPQNLTKKIGINNCRIYLSGLNLYTFHDVDFWDPERGIDGMGYGVYPVTKTLVGGIDLTF